MEQRRPATSWMDDPRNVAIALLTVVSLLLGAALARGRLQQPGGWFETRTVGETPVSVLDVVLDRQGLRYVDFLFDRPIGDDRVGEILAADAATMSPAVTGDWRWEGANILRFEPTSGLGLAMRYQFDLLGERILPEEHALVGETEFEIVTDQFQVERVDMYQEPTPDGSAVQIRGVARFNYDVDPEVLATRMGLSDPDDSEAPLLGGTVPLLFETYYADRILQFRSEPLHKQSAERELQLVIDQSLTPVNGNVPLTEPFRETVTLGSSEVLALWTITAEPDDPESRLRLQMSSQVDASAVSGFLTVRPEVPVRVTALRNELLLTGPFVAGSNYSIELAAGLPARDGASLREPASYTVTVPDMEPSLSFADQGMFLSASGGRELAIESVNVDNATLLIERVYRNNLFYLFDSYSWMVWDPHTYSGSAVSHSLGDRVAEQSLRLGSRRNQRRSTAVDLSLYLDDAEPGLYRIVLSRPGDYRAQQRWVAITDLGVVAKRGESDLLAWVSSFEDVAPIANAQVTVISSQNQIMDRGRTDARGLWHGREITDDPARPYMLLVERGADFSFLLFDGMRVDTTGLDVGGAYSTETGYQAFAYGERDIYRPGESVDAVAIVRDRELRAPPAMPLLLRHFDPTGMERATWRTQSNAQGMAAFDLELPTYARTGQHVVNIEAGGRNVGQYRFQVEEFVPDRIRVAIDPADDAVAPGAPLGFAVDSAYLFGPPAAGLEVEARVRLQAANFRPQAYADYTFADDSRVYPGSEVYFSEGALDETGRIELSADLPTGLRVPSTLDAVVTARVAEAGGRGVSARRSVRVHPYSYYLGLRRVGDGYAEPGVEQQFEFVAIGPDEQPAAAGALRAELYKDEWQTVLRRTPSGGFRYESTRDARLIEAIDVPAGARNGTVPFRPPEFGAYRVVLSDPVEGVSTQVAFTASGAGFSPWAIGNPARIDLELDRDEYSPGDTARLQVRSPFGGALLVTVEREGVAFSRVLALRGNTATVDIPVRGEYRPNAYVTATVIRSAGDLQQGGVARAFGAMPLPVDRGSNRLDLSIDHVEQMRPQGTLRVDLQTRPGASLTVAAVDEGILQLIAQQTPDPFEFFYRKLALGVGSFDTFSLLFPELDLDAAVGGGALADAMAQFASTSGIRRVVPVALWSGLVTADRNGAASVQFDVPRFQGALRVMAVAADGRAFGSASSTVVVRDPIVLLPTLPRFLTTGDQVEIPVTVRNDTGSGGPIEVRLTATLPGAPDIALSETVEVADGREQVTYFRLDSGAAEGAAGIEIEAAGLGESTSAGAELPVRHALPVERNQRVGSVTGELVLDETPLARLRPGAVRDLSISASPVLQFGGQLDYLVRYPYGCLEQVTSSAFPLLYLGDLAESVAPDLFDGTDGPAVFVQDAIRRLGTFQNFSGGFALWPGNDNLHPWASVYATHFLVEARTAGFLVPESLYDRAIEFVRSEVRVGNDPVHDQLQRVVYGLYVLARAGVADVGVMDFTRQRYRDQMDPETRALLAAAYAATGNTPAIEELLLDLQQIEEFNRQTGGNFNSPVRNRALLLMAMLDARPDDFRVTDLVRRLSRDAAEQSWSTQESSFALLAVGRLLAAGEAQSFSGTVARGGEVLGTFDQAGATFPAIEGDGALRIALDEAIDGPGAFYVETTSGVPTDEGFVLRREGLEIQRSFLSRNGGAVDLASVQQGDLLVLRVRARSLSGAVDNVVVQNLLPSGLEVENPRLSSTETLPWIEDANMAPDYVDLRDDRILLFTSLPDQEWQTSYALVRAVTPGRFAVPPAQAEAMYDPRLRANTPGDELVVGRR